MHPRRFPSLLLSALVLAVLAACGGQQGAAPASGPSAQMGQAPRGGPGGAAPSATVEQVLRLAGRKQYLDMGWLFGTVEGGAIMGRDPRADVERRMFALASVLENQQFVIRDEQPIPGSVGQSVRITVQLNQRGRTTNVPFVTVRGPGDRWFIEQVDVQAVTSPRR